MSSFRISVEQKLINPVTWRELLSKPHDDAPNVQSSASSLQSRLAIKANVSKVVEGEKTQEPIVITVTVSVEQELLNPMIWRELPSKSHNDVPKVRSSAPGPPKNLAFKDSVPKVVDIEKGAESDVSTVIAVEPEETPLALKDVKVEEKKGSVSTVKEVKPEETTSAVEDIQVEEDKGAVATVTEIEPKETPSAVEELALSTDPLTKLASDILDVMERYGHHLPSQESGHPVTGWIGKLFFMDRVKKQVEKNQAIQIILPAFPWKSINKVDKVTGVLPDLGEELALSRLNQLCEDIKEVYPLGGEVHIATDGLVFDDVVGISDEDTWAYSEGLLQLTKEKGYEKNIKLIRVMDILGYTEGKTLDKELYLLLVEKCRTELLESYGRTEDEVREMMQSDPDTLLTYRGFIRFLETDLKHSPIAQNAPSGQKFRKCVKQVATNMMIRAESFTKLLQAKKPEHVRLSIHPSTGAVKLSIPLIIQGSGEFPKTPWHSSIAVALDGSYSTVHSKTVRDTHNLIYKHGRPYYYREKSAIWDWEDEDVIFEPQYPDCMLVYPRAGTEGEKLLTESQLENLQRLRLVHKGPVKVTGFQNAASASASAD